MKNCVHPRKAYNLMKTFLNTASDLYCDDEKTEITLHKSDSFAAESVNCVADCDTLEVYYNYDNLHDEGSKVFRSYWTKREKMLKGFADITLSLLHELGHLETNDKVRKDFSYEMRQLTWSAIDFTYESIEEKNLKYFEMPDETAATEWAIKWLQNADNRKTAKAFEKRFMACFA